MCRGYPNDGQARGFVAVARGAVTGVLWDRGQLRFLPSQPSRPPAPQAAGTSQPLTCDRQPHPHLAGPCLCPSPSQPRPGLWPWWVHLLPPLWACVQPFEAASDWFSSRGKNTHPQPPEPWVWVFPGIWPMRCGISRPCTQRVWQP